MEYLLSRSRKMTKNLVDIELRLGITLDLARMVLKQGLPPDTLLNVNVPNSPLKQIQGVKFTSLSRRQYKNPVIEKVDPRGISYYWIAGERISWQRQKTIRF